MLFEPPEMTRDEALEIIERYPIGARFSSEYQKCTGACCRVPGARGHGPNWVAVVRTTEGRRRLYIGTNEKKKRIEQAHALIRAEIGKLEAKLAARIRAVGQSRAARELAELEQRVLMPTSPRSRRRPASRWDVVDVPIIDITPRKEPA